MSRDRTVSRYLLPLVIGLVVLLVGVVFYWPANDPEPDGSGARGGDFVLQGAEGPVALSDHRGKVVLIYFGYTFCPDVCPMSLAVLGEALDSLTEKELGKVHGIFVSVDPERDEAERLTAYARYFHPEITGATSRVDVIRELADRYGVFFRKIEGESAGGYLVDHSSITQVVDPDGRLVRQLPHGTTPAEIVTVVREVLAQGS